MTEKILDEVLAFIESEGLMAKLEAHLAPKVEEVKFEKIKNLLGATGSRANGEELKEKFVAFMDGHSNGKNPSKGVHIDDITVATRGITKLSPLTPAWKKAKNSCQNWLTSNQIGKNGKAALVGKVEGVEAHYYYIAPKAEAVVKVLDTPITTGKVKV